MNVLKGDRTPHSLGKVGNPVSFIDVSEVNESPIRHESQEDRKDVVMELAYVTVGIIVNTHGLRGEVRVLSRTERPKLRFSVNSVLQVRKPQGTPNRTLQVVESRQHKQFWLLKFDGISTIEEAELLKGMELCVSVDELPQLEEGSYYIHELIGLNVVTDVGQSLGRIKEVLTPGANDVYVVVPDKGKDILIPAIKDCVLNVDLDSGVMLVHLLPGLAEED